MGGGLNEARPVYEQLWREAMPAFEQNRFDLDPQLPDKSRDRRRGVTLVFRPSRNLLDSLRPFLHELAAAAPAQYCYGPADLHVTVLSLIPGSEFWREQLPHLAAYKSILRDVLSRHRKFTVSFQGVTASPGAMMIQGFPGDATLRAIRNELRARLGQTPWGVGLDVR